MDGTVRNSLCGRAVEHYVAMALMKRSPKMTANWALAMDHSRGGIFHSFSDRFKIIEQLGRRVIAGDVAPAITYRMRRETPFKDKVMFRTVTVLLPMVRISKPRSRALRMASKIISVPYK
jgi:hypothetical protein